MSYFTEENLTKDVNGRLDNCHDPRMKEIMSSLITHLHSFIRDVEPSPKEWFAGIQFLTETGQMCDGQRQEFILLSDVLGVSMLADAINNRKPAGATESSVLGPFYTKGAPEMNSEADLAPSEGPGVIVSGFVRAINGEPLGGAVLDIWQADPSGLYHMQDEDQSEHHLCGKVRTNDDGSYSFRTLKPVSYSIPTDGPVGKMLVELGRHSFRPAHIHFIASAPGYKTLVTQLFSEGDSYLETDTVFGVKRSLVVDYIPTGDDWTVAYDFVLEPES